MPTSSLSELVQPWLFCDNCNQSFRRPQDMARHRCDSIRSIQTAAEKINSGIMCSICGVCVCVCVCAITCLLSSHIGLISTIPDGFAQ